MSRSTPRLASLNPEVDMPDPRPNILLITTDQQRGDCLSLDSHGPSCLQTPTWTGLPAQERTSPRILRMS
ncbi:TPA: hypothetical protein EYO57_21390 [Candidatus Poribacteria bacterium]|nr:hypothetical protein [Candidatus Poribacteria bacterium]